MSTLQQQLDDMAAWEERNRKATATLQEMNIEKSTDRVVIGEDGTVYRTSGTEKESRIEIPVK